MNNIISTVSQLAGDFIRPQLSIWAALCNVIFVRLRGGPENHEPNGGHQYYCDPVRYVPCKDSFVHTFY